MSITPNVVVGEPGDTKEKDDADDLLAELEAEDDLAYRAQRAQELSIDLGQSKRTEVFKTVQDTFLTLGGDDETLRFTTEHERAVVHFFHPEFARCSTMDTHLRELSNKHANYGNGDVAFGRVDVKNAPFIVEKLGVRVLPCVVGFVKGVVKGRVTGFEGLCWDGKEGDTAVTRALEQCLLEWTVIKRRLLLGYKDGDEDDRSEEEEQESKVGNGRARRGIRGRKHSGNEDDDEEWD